jgi:hypothetical protein
MKRGALLIDVRTIVAASSTSTRSAKPSRRRHVRARPIPWTTTNTPVPKMIASVSEPPLK